MLVTPQTVTVKWIGATKNHYISKGYKFTKIGDTFTVNAEDLTKGSAVKVKVKCDHCGRISEKAFCLYTKQIERDGTSYCGKCSGAKTREVFRRNFGFDWNPWEWNKKAQHRHNVMTKSEK